MQSTHHNKASTPITNERWFMHHTRTGITHRAKGRPDTREERGEAPNRSAKRGERSRPSIEGRARHLYFCRYLSIVRYLYRLPTYCHVDQQQLCFTRCRRQRTRCIRWSSLLTRSERGRLLDTEGRRQRASTRHDRSDQPMWWVCKPTRSNTCEFCA